MGCEEEGRLVRAIRIAPGARRRPRRRRRLPTPTLPHRARARGRKERREAVSSADVARRRGIPCDAQEIGCRAAGASPRPAQLCRSSDVNVKKEQPSAAPEGRMGRLTHRPRSKSARGSLQERKRGERARLTSYLLQTLLLSYAAISTRVYPSHPNREYKLVRARVVLRWGTTREGRVLHIFVLFCCAGAREAGPTSLTPFCKFIDTGR
jgi:hypothetical protein